MGGAKGGGREYAGGLGGEAIGIQIRVGESGEEGEEEGFGVGGGREVRRIGDGAESGRGGAVGGGRDEAGGGELWSRGGEVGRGGKGGKPIVG